MTHLYLTLPLARSWFIDRHLNGLIPVTDYNRPESTVFSMHLIAETIRQGSNGRSITYNVIINRPELVELKHLLIPVSHWYHLIVALVTNHMINEVYHTWRTGKEDGERRERVLQCFQQTVFVEWLLIAR